MTDYKDLIRDALLSSMPRSGTKAYDDAVHFVQWVATVQSPFNWFSSDGVNRLAEKALHDERILDFVLRLQFQVFSRWTDYDTEYPVMLKCWARGVSLIPKDSALGLLSELTISESISETEFIDFVTNNTWMVSLLFINQYVDFDDIQTLLNGLENEKAKESS
jgi:hypothetical protein